MALKWCTKLNVVKMSCPIVFQDHPPHFKVTRDKNRQLWHKFNVSRLQIQFEFTDGFEMIHNAWRSIEEVPYCFSRSSIKLQGHKGWQIDDLNPIWVSLLGRSQLSNPSDLPCCYGGVHEIYLYCFIACFVRNDEIKMFNHVQSWKIPIAYKILSFIALLDVFH